MENTICIDFGARKSSVYFYKGGKLVHLDFDQGSYFLPSYVMYQQGQAVVGTAAMRWFGGNNRFVIGSVKRIIGLDYDEYLSYGDPNIFGCEVKKLEFKLLVHEDGQLELTCLDMNKGEMLESSICPSLQIV